MLYTVQQSLDHTSVWERRLFFATFSIPVVFRSADNEYEQENTRKGCYCYPEGNTWNTLTCTLRVKNGGRDAGPRAPSHDQIYPY